MSYKVKERDEERVERIVGDFTKLDQQFITELM